MNKEKAVLLSHYDLDGAGCSVLSNHIWKIVQRKHQGYPKIRQSLDYLVEGFSDVPNIVIADLKIDPDDLRYAMENFQNVIYYDHHESSEEFAAATWKEWNGDNIEVHFSLDYCSTALMWLDGCRNRGANKTPALNAFANTVNAYDLWKQDHSRFEDGVILNDMFWDLGLWKFKDRFADGFSGLTESERVWAENVQAERLKVIHNATVEEMESGSKIVVVESANAINFVSRELDGDLFYIISPDYSIHAVSVRVKDSDSKFNVNDGICELGIRYPKIVHSAGGHAAAGGISFKDHLSMNEIVDFLYDEDLAIRGDYCGAGT